MKKILFCCCLFCLCAYPVYVYAQSSSNLEYAEEEQYKSKKRVKKKQSIQCGYSRHINVAGFVTNPPFGWVDMKEKKNKDELLYINDGYVYDLFTDMADDLDLKVKNVGYTSYQEALRDLRRGDIDVIVGTYYNKDILGVGISLLTPSVIPNPIVPIFVKGKEKKVTSFRDLKGLKGVVRKEELIFPLIYQQLPDGVEIKQVSGSKNAYKMLINGEADYMITSLYSGEAEVRRFKIVDEIVFPTQALLKPEVFIAFSAHTDCYRLKPLFQKKLEEMQKNNSAYMSNFISYITNWGRRFADEPSLVDEIRNEK